MKLDIDIDNKGFTQIRKKLQNGATAPLSSAITRIATFMERTAKEKLQKSVYASAESKWYTRTGKARQSITRSQVAPLTQKVYMGVNYGKYLESGTGAYNGRSAFWTTFGGRLEEAVLYKGMKKRPFWKPAIKETRKNVKRILKEEVEKSLNT